MICSKSWNLSQAKINKHTIKCMHIEFLIKIEDFGKKKY